MHELGLTQGILDIAIEHAKKNDATRILLVNVKAGDLMALIEDSMQFYFEYLTKDTLAEGAELAIERVPIVIQCATCAEESTVGEFETHLCPSCGSPVVTLISGKEFFVESIEIE